VSKSVKPSVKAQKNLEPQLNSNSSSSRKTKNEITDRPNELIDIELFEYWVDNLDAPTQEAFNSFAKNTTSVIEIYIYARFLGYKGSIVACELWVKKNYRKVDYGKKLREEVDKMLVDIDFLRSEIEDGIIKRDVGVRQIAAMQRELRGHIDQIQKTNNHKDRKALVMAGADRAIRELVLTFQDDPIGIPLEEASMGVWARMQLDE
jgi:hypothetical protein